MATTITIDTDLQLPKTSFKNPIEAIYFLTHAQIQDPSILLDQDPFWLNESPKNDLAYNVSVSWDNEQYTLSDAQSIVLWDIQ